jgi:HSP20 family protein
MENHDNPERTSFQAKGIHARIWDFIRRYLLGIRKSSGTRVLPPPGPDSGWRTPVDVAEGVDTIIVQAEVPGIQPRDVDVEVHGRRLALSGSKQAGLGNKASGVHCAEISSGPFSRVIYLPAEVHERPHVLRHRNGVLTLVLWKRTAGSNAAVKKCQLAGAKS